MIFFSLICFALIITSAIINFMFAQYTKNLLRKRQRKNALRSGKVLRMNKKKKQPKKKNEIFLWKHHVKVRQICVQKKNTSKTFGTGRIHSLLFWIVCPRQTSSTAQIIPRKKLTGTELKRAINKSEQKYRKKVSNWLKFTLFTKAFAYHRCVFYGPNMKVIYWNRSFEIPRDFSYWITKRLCAKWNL